MGTFHFVAAAERVCDAGVDADEAFGRLRDFPGWAAWMPESFRPVSGPNRALVVGDQVVVRIAGARFPTKLDVVEVTADAVRGARAIAWTGGVRGVLSAVHRFVFDGDARCVRSVETWTGALAPVARPIVRPIAERIGREQLTGLLTRGHGATPRS
jgi:hypothetical protein